MAKNSKSTKVICVACGKRREIFHSLRLVRENGKWVSQPVCKVCRNLLIAEAKEAGKFIPFFPILSSQKEAERRNGDAPLRASLLERFGKSRKTRTK